MYVLWYVCAEVTSPPFELNETGWGEFDLNIKIFFHDLNAKPITRKHTLRLYHNGGQISKEAVCVILSVLTV